MLSRKKCISLRNKLDEACELLRNIEHVICACVTSYQVRDVFTGSNIIASNGYVELLLPIYTCLYVYSYTLYACVY